MTELKKFNLRGWTLRAMISAVIGAFFLASVGLIEASDLVINEIYPNPPGSSEGEEFVEIYNTSDVEITLTGFKLADLVKTYIIPEATISARGFWSFRRETTAIALNNTGDTIYFKDSGGGEIDRYEYSNTTEGKSFSRIPDGTGSFQSETEPTESLANQAAPSPTPSPSPLPSPDPSPSPSPIPSPTPVNIVSPSPNLVKKSKVTSLEGVESTESGLMLMASSRSGEVKGASKSSDAVKNRKPLIVAVVLIVLGLGLVVGTGVVFIKEQRYNKTDAKRDEKT